MRIGIDARGANWYSGTGIGTYTSQLVKHLVEMDKNNFYHLYWWGDNYRELCGDNITINIVSKKHRKFFEDRYFPCNLKNSGVDLYHVPQNGIGLPAKKNCIYLSTIHDLIPYVMPETVGKGYLKRFISAMPQIVQNSNRIITVSEYSKRDLIKIFNLEEDMILVTPLAAEDYFRPMEKEAAKLYLHEYYGIDKDFLLYLGGFSPRKNVKSILIAYARLYKSLSKDYRIVILGSANDSHAYLMQLCESLSISDRVIFTGYVPNEALPYFYNSCSVFVYPSLYEGFGLPPLEAMSCGVPVITSNVSSIPEVVGDAALKINPFDTEELKTAMELMLEDTVLADRYGKLGLERSAQYTWQNTAKLTLALYENIYREIVS